MSDQAPVSKPMFVDEAEIVVAGGDGGNGCVAFRREKFIPKGGPSGGDGGDGGSVFCQADESYNTLQHLAGHHHWHAQRGGYGMGKNRHGKNGGDVVILVPPGTIVYDADSGILLKDLAGHGQCVCVAAGGKGGRGNVRFKTSTNQAPREAEDGEEGQQRRLRLRLKLIADAGLIGKPNAGKSTLISRLSSARPKIADYPFTTLVPCLGIVELRGFRRFVMADIPGLIEGAHAGVGLGDEFLRHVERTRILVHVIDLCPPTGKPAENYRAIRRELQQYSKELSEKPEIIVANKTDLTGSAGQLERLREELGEKVLAVSAVTGDGLERLGETIWRRLHDDGSEG